MVSYLRSPAGAALASLGLAACAVIVVASYAPRHAPLAAPLALVAVSTLLCAAGGLRGLRAGIAGNVARPTLAAATVAVAFLELVFTHDGMRGTPLALLTAALVLVVLDLPLLIGSEAA